MEKKDVRKGIFVKISADSESKYQVFKINWEEQPPITIFRLDDDLKVRVDKFKVKVNAIDINPI
jgi:hypothetical protein